MTLDLIAADQAFWEVTTKVVLLAFTLVILGAAAALVLALIGGSRDDHDPDDEGGTHVAPADMVPTDARLRASLDLAARARTRVSDVRVLRSGVPRVVPSLDRSFKRGHKSIARR
jgi:hypothetical protein